MSDTMDDVIFHLKNEELKLKLGRELALWMTKVFIIKAVLLIVSFH